MMLIIILLTINYNTTDRDNYNTTDCNYNTTDIDMDIIILLTIVTWL